MTIKQTGGIFGRNPTFSDVDAESLTLTDSSPLLKMVDADATAQVAEINCGFGHIDIKADVNNDRGSSRITFQIDGSEVGRWNNSGNLVIANSGNGIDFSATAGTGTSELFDDYEEGTWTGTLIGVTTAGASPTATGNYTKVGDRVHIYISFSAADTTSAAGNIRVTGLPFTSTSASLGDCYNSRGPSTASMANIPTGNTFISQVGPTSSSENWASSGTTYAAYAATYKA